MLEIASCKLLASRLWVRIVEGFLPFHTLSLRSFNVWHSLGSAIIAQICMFPSGIRSACFQLLCLPSSLHADSCYHKFCLASFKRIRFLLFAFPCVCIVPTTYSDRSATSALVICLIFVFALFVPSLNLIVRLIQKMGTSRASVLPFLFFVQHEQKMCTEWKQKTLLQAKVWLPVTPLFLVATLHLWLWTSTLALNVPDSRCKFPC